LKAGRDYHKSKIFNTIPVVAGWKTAIEAAKKTEGMSFKVTAFDARNPEHDPAKDPIAGAYRMELLTKLTNQVKSGGAGEFGG